VPGKVDQLLLVPQPAQVAERPHHARQARHAADIEQAAIDLAACRGQRPSGQAGIASVLRAGTERAEEQCDATESVEQIGSEWTQCPVRPRLELTPSH
jgi:hypothetical protein